MSAALTVCVYCGSRLGENLLFRHAAAAMGRGLAERDITLVYGGGRVGTMAVLADAALAAGGRVIGVIPHHLERKEVGHRGVAELFIVDTMHERKAKMASLADAFVVLPGGLGTLDEMFEILTWKQIGLHDSAILIVDVDGYWRDLLAQLDRAVAEDFVAAADLELFELFDTVDAALARLDALRPHLRAQQLNRA